MGKSEQKKLITGKAQTAKQEKKETKAKRIRRTKKQIIVDKLEKFYKEDVIASVFGSEMKKIVASLEKLESSMKNKGPVKRFSAKRIAKKVTKDLTEEQKQAIIQELQALKK